MIARCFGMSRAAIYKSLKSQKIQQTQTEKIIGLVKQVANECQG